MTERTGGAEFLGEIKEPYAKCSGCPVITLSFSGGSQPKPADQLPLVGGEDHSFPKGPEALMLWESPGLHLQEGGVQRLWEGPLVESMKAQHWDPARTGAGSSWPLFFAREIEVSTLSGFVTVISRTCSWVGTALMASGSVHPMESSGDVLQEWGFGDTSFLMSFSSLHLLRHQPSTWHQFPHIGQWMQIQVIPVLGFLSPSWATKLGSYLLRIF